MNKQRLKTWAAALAILGSVGYVALRIIAFTTEPKEQK